MSTSTWSAIALCTAAVLVGGSLGAILSFRLLSDVVSFRVWLWKTKTGDTP